MNIHEYQAKEVLRRFGVPTLKGEVANSPEEAVTKFIPIIFEATL